MAEPSTMRISPASSAAEWARSAVSRDRRRSDAGGVVATAGWYEAVAGGSFCGSTRSPDCGLMPVSWTPRNGCFMKPEVADGKAKVLA